MSTHVHMLLSPGLDEADHAYTIAEILHGIRGGSAHRINRLLNRNGRLWQDEYFDRLVRDGEFQKYVDYICRNPEKAGVAIREENYAWLWLDPEV
jgi:putative transposase